MYQSVLNVDVERSVFVANRFAIELYIGFSWREYIGPSISFDSMETNVELILLARSRMISFSLLFDTILETLESSSRFNGPTGRVESYFDSCLSFLREDHN